MSLIVKMMSDENLADDDTRKTFILHTGVKHIVFDRTMDGECYAHIWHEDAPLDGDCRRYRITANVYVLNEAGRTISSFCSAALPRPTRAEPVGLAA